MLRNSNWRLRVNTHLHSLTHTVALPWSSACVCIRYFLLLLFFIIILFIFFFIFWFYYTTRRLPFFQSPENLVNWHANIYAMRRWPKSTLNINKCLTTILVGQFVLSFLSGAFHYYCLFGGDGGARKKPLEKREAEFVGVGKSRSKKTYENALLF